MEGKSLDQMKDEAIEKLYFEILHQMEFYKNQENQVMLAKLNNVDEVYVKLDTEDKRTAKFTVNSAIRGLGTIKVGESVRRSLFFKMSGIKFEEYHKNKMEK